jgi:N-methylhydantoinase A
VDPATGARAALPEVARDALAPGATLEGPAVVVEDETTLYLPAAFALTVLGDGTLDCRRRAATTQGGTVDAA